MASSSPASPFLLPSTSLASGNDEGDLLGRPRSSRYAASCLARMPPDEGWDDLAIGRRESVPREERNTHERHRLVAGSHGGLDGVDQGFSFESCARYRNDQALARGYSNESTTSSLRIDRKTNLNAVGPFVGVSRVAAGR